MRLEDQHNGWHSGAAGRNTTVSGQNCHGNSSGRSNSLRALRLQFWRGGHQRGKIVGNSGAFSYKMSIERYRSSVGLMVLSEQPANIKLSTVWLARSP
jgi:hypothetical protein